MRAADAVSLLRIPLIILAVYAIAARLSPYTSTFLLLFLFFSDALDGYFASSGKHSLPDLVSYFVEEAAGRKGKRKFPKNMPKSGAYLDIAVDRLIEYALWGLFVYVLIIPWWVLGIIFVRNTIADALVLRKGKTFSKMRSNFGRIASSHLSRGLYAGLKGLNFIYLSLVFVSGFPLNIGYALSTLVVLFSLARGAAEVYESL